MCWQKDTYHVPCEHYGRPKVVTTCPRASAPGGCLYIFKTEGIERIPEPCYTCKYREKHNVKSGFTFCDREGKVSECTRETIREAQAKAMQERLERERKEQEDIEKAGLYGIWPVKKEA